ncbi:MAG TPA: C25 family cysteine peptidase [Candidatus Thermoplasmatota archaeon]|nr:C25 family cysteine peptidase [Candidatus Thermoplasmatota archaeon]
MKNVLSFLIVGMLLACGAGSVVATSTSHSTTQLRETLTFSEPVLSTHNGYTTVQLPETTTSSSAPGDPVLPYYTKVFTFPLGTTINQVTCGASTAETIVVPFDILPAPEPTRVSDTSSPSGNIPGTKNRDIYADVNPFPLSRVSYQVGGGLDRDSHVTILSITYYPLQYSPTQHRLSFTPEVQMIVSYELPRNPSTLRTSMNLLVIAPSGYTSALQPLIDHKNQNGFMTTLLTTEDIYATYQGRDQAEQIKYAIKNKVETQAVSYVLLVGSIYKIPIRISEASSHEYFGGQVITDLYYADVYDSQGNFCSWDANNNSIFGEITDKVDLYPDVRLGRLACDSVDEVNVVVDKIVHYETDTYGSSWYNNLILMGGNTFFWPGNEGEETNTLVMHLMSQFTPEIIWTSKHNFDRLTISRTITKGAGFLDYSGHGVEYGIITYTPSYLEKKAFITPYLKDLHNGYKLPVVFLDACSTATLDFVLQNFLDYKTWFMLNVLAHALKVNTSQRLTCFAWAFVAHQGGGAIATIGATRVAYGGNDQGAGKIALEFFSSFNSSQYLGEMASKMQTGYINDVHGDSFTVEEFILLGDPTLRLGGYPS